jgi:hypothetical protein
MVPASEEMFAKNKAKNAALLGRCERRSTMLGRWGWQGHQTDDAAGEGRVRLQTNERDPRLRLQVEEDWT